MSNCQDKHGWKWIGVPHNGVLGLFPASPATEGDSASQGLHNERPHASDEQVEDKIIDPPSEPLVIRLVFLVMELVLAHAAGFLFVLCGSITKTTTLYLTGSGVLAEATYSAVFSSGILFTMAKLFKQHDLYLFMKRLGLFWTPVSTILATVTVQSLLLVYLSKMVPTTSDHPDLSPLPHDILALVLRFSVLTPLEEGLFFRGLVLHLALNRLEGPHRRIRSLNETSSKDNGMVASAFISAACFVGVHVAIQPNGGDVDAIAKLVCGLALGFVWGSRFVMRGSMLECVVLHSVYNFFTALASTPLPQKGVETLIMGIVTTMLIM